MTLRDLVLCPGTRHGLGLRADLAHAARRYDNAEQREKQAVRLDIRTEPSQRACRPSPASPPAAAKLSAPQREVISLTRRQPSGTCCHLREHLASLRMLKENRGAGGSGDVEAEHLDGVATHDLVDLLG
jgi:hypothetical protein